MFTNKQKKRFCNHCKGKQKHISKEAAFGFLNNWRKKYNIPKNQITQRPYECNFCGQWHLGTKSENT